MKERPALFAVTGGLVIAAIAIGMVLGARGGAASKPGYVLIAKFEQADGISVGSPVYLAGVKVGTVEHMALETKTLKPVVRIRIANQIGIPEESAAMIMSDGVLGSKFIKIEPGSGDDMMPKGSEFYLVQDAIIVEDLLERIVDSAEAARKPVARKQP